MKDAETLRQRLAPGPRGLLELIGRLAEARGEPAWLVGGTVRDLILERPSEDLDVVVEGDGMALAQDLSRAEAGALTRHHAFRTARVDLPGGQRVDFASARAESYSRPAELPRVTAGDLEQDLARRDFTINAIAMSLAPGSSALADPFDGVGDIGRGLVRFLHEGSFRDDPTRALRAVRFAVRFDYEIEERTAAGLRDAARGGYLERLTGDRLRRELAKLLAEAPVEGPLALDANGLLAGIDPQLVADRGCLERLQTGMRPTVSDPDASQAPEAWSLVLAAMAPRMAQQHRWVLTRRLRLSREERAALIDSGAPWERLLKQFAADEQDLLAGVEALEKLDPGAVQVGLAGLRDESLRARIERLVVQSRGSMPELSGDDLIALGCEPGPQVGEMLGRLRAARLAGDVRTADEERVAVLRWFDHPGGE